MANFQKRKHGDKESSHKQAFPNFVTLGDTNPYASQIDDWTSDLQVRKTLKAAQTACVFVDHPSDTEIGSGVMISERGLILTAAHCTAEVGSVRRIGFINGDECDGVTIAVSSTHDLALISTRPATTSSKNESVHPFCFVAASALRKNESCFIIGQPYYKRKSSKYSAKQQTEFGISHFYIFIYIMNSRHFHSPKKIVHLTSK